LKNGGEFLGKGGGDVGEEVHWPAEGAEAVIPPLSGRGVSPYSTGASSESGPSLSMPPVTLSGFSKPRSP
jgi:hypothetical protein